MILAYRCAYCSQWNPSLKPRPQLAITYTNNESMQNQSSEIIEEIVDEISLKNDSDTIKSENSEQKKDIVTGKINLNKLFFFIF